jgi:hypothetical protein
VVLCPDVAPYIDSHFDCCDLLQRSVIHYGAERKASSAIISIPYSGRNDRNGMLRVYLAGPSEDRSSGLVSFPIQAGAFNIGRLSVSVQSLSHFWLG